MLAAVTCQLFLRLGRVGVSEQSHGLADAAAALDLLLAAVVLEGEVAQGGRGRLADLRAGAAQQSNQRRDSLQLQHLSGDEVPTRHQSQFDSRDCAHGEGLEPV